MRVFLINAIKYCLKENKIRLTDVDLVVFYDKPLVKFERLLETYLSYAPKGFRSFLAAMPIWLKEKLFLKMPLIKRAGRAWWVCRLGSSPSVICGTSSVTCRICFFPNPYEKASVLCLDGVGEWATTSVWLGEGNRLTLHWEIDFPHSLGLLYSTLYLLYGLQGQLG